MKFSWKVLAVASLLLNIASAHATQALQGAGSSAAAPIFQGWSRAYQQATGIQLAYEPVGSIEGVKRARARQVGFGATDVAPPEAELAAGGLMLLPVAVTGVAPVLNLPRMADGQLRLTGEVLAGIFLGEITSWNAPQIAQLNAGLTLPQLPIKVVVRGDGSGTTNNFAQYLAAASTAWKGAHPQSFAVRWPAGFVQVAGSSAMAKAVAETPGAIGYVDHAYVKSSRLSVARLRNADGEFVLPSTATFRAALGTSDWMHGSFADSLLNRPGKTSWPLTVAAYAVLPRTADKPDQALAVLRFFAWALSHGDALVQESHFVRLPDRVQAAAFKALTTVQDASGRPLGMAVLATSVK